MFRFIFRLLGRVLEKTSPLDGISLSDDNVWIVDPPNDPANYFRALVSLVPEESVVCLEGSTEPDFWQLSQSRQVSDPTKVAAGTIWPKSDFCHVCATRQNLDDLANAVARWRIVVPAIHTHVYCGESMILQWYDAFCDDPILVSGDVDESVVKKFADVLGSGYHRRINSD